MLQVPFLIILAIFCLAGFLEIIVLNEEALLCLCFVSFVFCIHRFLNSEVSDFFSSHAQKIRNDIFFVFDSKHESTKQSLIKISEQTQGRKALHLIQKVLSNSFAVTYDKQIVSQKAYFVGIAIEKLQLLLKSKSTQLTTLQTKNIHVTLFSIVSTLLKKRNILV
jgi:hypothetical protein